MSELHARLAVYRDRHDHEWVLLSGRLNTLMTSQAFFIAACAALYINAHPDTNAPPRAESYAIITLIAAVALAICFMASLVILINCRVIRDWHIEANRLFAADKKGELQGYYIPRNQIDLRHVLTADVFSLMLPLLLGFLWLETLYNVSSVRGMTRSAMHGNVPSPILDNMVPKLHNITTFFLELSNECYIGCIILLWIVSLVVIYFKSSLHSRKRQGGPSAS